MRIGLVAPPWMPVPPPSYGGTEQIIDTLARGLSNAGHEVVLFSTGDASCPVPRSFAYPRAERDRLGQTAPELYHVLRAYEYLEGYDVIHDHTLLGPVIGARSNERIVTTNHSLFSEERLEIYRSIHERVAIVAISHDQASRAQDVSIARVVHHGLDPDAYSLGTGGGGYLLFLGRMAPDKGVGTAIRVARASGRRLLIAAKLQEVGEHRYYEERVRPLLDDDVEFLGEVNRARKRDLLAHAEALLNPIHWPEPFGLVMIEALASGTPVVAFRRGAAPEIVEHGVSGYLCDNEQQMTEALDRLDNIDRQMCRRSFTERFTSARMVRQYLSLYENLIGVGDPTRMVDAGQ